MSGSENDVWDGRIEPLLALQHLLAPVQHSGAELGGGPPAGYVHDATYDIPVPRQFTDVSNSRTEWNELLGLSRREVAAAQREQPEDDAMGRHYEAYCRASADVTMKGGTTSGIVYPLAVCEIARSFKLRNVGGTSAGALAAAAAAAAELGRTRANAGVPLDPPPPGAPQPGFAGLASIPQWLTQLEPGAAIDEEHRLASLFAPEDGPEDTDATTATDKRWFRVVAFWANRGERLSKLPGVLRSLGIGPIWLTFALLVVILATITLDRAGVPAGVLRPWWALLLSIAGGAAATLLLAAGAGSAIAGMVHWRTDRRRIARARAWSGLDEAYWELRRAGLMPSPFPRRAIRNGLLAAFGGTVILGLLATVVSAVPGTSLLVTLAVVGAAIMLCTLVFAVQVAEASVRLFRGFRTDHHFGLLTGKHLVKWVDLQLRGLSGQNRTVTFGDLWSGARPHSTDLLHALSRDEFLRSVNLKLMVTDLSQQRPFRFPLPEHSELAESIGSKLYASPADLRPIFGDDLTELIAPPNEQGGLYYTWNDESGSYTAVELRPIAEPWDLPVVFAVRASMSLPFLFRAVRVYRVRPPTTVRDNYGDPIPADTAPFTSPTPPAGTAAPGQPWLLAEELWLSDGGVTSNFPVHLFDRQLPEWPTFGLNLGAHPLGYEHQDVWLPEDWQAHVPRWTRVRDSAGAFATAIIDTAREWRDVMQTHMPSTRGRVAWVWLKPSEGGTNLFMRRERVAALCVRGALAGMRLRTRFEDSSDRWHRHRWLRMRATLHALDQVRDDVAIALPHYRDLLNPASAARAARISGADPAPPDFLPPDQAFWPAATVMLERLAAEDLETKDFQNETPKPAPELRHVPRV